MNDFDTQLTAILDDVAATIDPHPDFDGVGTPRATIDPIGGAGRRRFPRALGIAAATIVLLGGGVAAFEAASSGDPDTVSTSSGVTDGGAADVAAPTSAPVTDEPADEPVVVAPADEKERDDEDADATPDDSRPWLHRTAQLGKADLTADPIVLYLYGRAAPGETVEAASEFGSASAVASADAKWELAIELREVPAAAVVPISVSFGDSAFVYEFDVEVPSDGSDKAPPPDTVVEPEPEKPSKPVEEPSKPVEKLPPVEAPEPIAFSAHLGWSYNDDVHMKQGFYGSAPAGSKVTVSSEWGSVHTTAGPKGEWETHLKLTEVPDGTVVHVRVFSEASDRVVDFELVRERPEPEPEPEPVPFTATLGTSWLDGSPMKQGFYGTGTPGSVVVASSEYGSADAVVGPKGHWELHLKMYEVPAGTTVGVLVTNNASDAVHDFGLLRPEPEPEPEPEPVDFTADAALEVSDSNPLVNEYWGTSTPGAKITISSPYGGGHVTANGDGFWDARIEFEGAPVGEPFTVTITSSKGEAVYEFALTWLQPD